jgi:hypothetical protein
MIFQLYPPFPSDVAAVSGAEVKLIAKVKEYELARFLHRKPYQEKPG